MPVTKADIDKYRDDHYDLFKLLVDTAEYNINVIKTYGLGTPAVHDFYIKFIDIVQDWYNREIEMEQLFMQHTGAKGMIFSGDLEINDFWSEGSGPKLRALVNKAGDYYKGIKL